MHQLLGRQLKGLLGVDSLEAVPESLRGLMGAVNEAYEQADTDRQLLERSLELTSQELIERNKELWGDVADRKQAETFLSGQKRVLELIAAEAEPSQVLDILCRVVEERAPKLCCTVCLVDETGARLRLAAAPSLPDAYRRTVDQLPIGPNAGSCGTAAFRRQPVFVASIATDLLWAAYAEPAVAHGFQACWSKPILAGDGQVLGTVGIYSRDAHSPSPLSMQLLEYAARFAGIAIERTRAKRLLQQQAEALARSAQELEQFTYVASHDLQEPLRMVASYTQLLARRYKGKLDSTADEFIDYAVGGVTRMQQLIKDLLAYSRVDTRGNALKPTPSQAAFDQAVDNLQMRIQDHHAVVAHGPLPTVVGDHTQLVQLFQNLVGNAVKFQKPGAPPHVDVSATPRGAEWLFAVRDDGVGIDLKYAEQIFMIFKRLHTDAEYQGTGIGLAICKKIVERHGGRIWVESQPGQGATFWFTVSKKGERA